jgi:hypothetical protein
MVNRVIFGAENLLPAVLLTRGISFYAGLVVGGIVTLTSHLSLLRRGAVREN